MNSIMAFVSALSGMTKESASADKLVITSISASPVLSGTAFDVTVQLQDSTGTPKSAATDLPIQLADRGVGVLSGTKTGTLTAGTSSVTITGAIYTNAAGEVGAVLLAGAGTTTINHAEYSFNVRAEEPGVQAKTVLFTKLTGSYRVSWTNGSGVGRIAVIRAVSTPIAPVDGNLYTANSQVGLGDDLGSGSYVIYIGTGSSVEITGYTLGSNTVAVYEYNGVESEPETINYKTVTGSWNPRGSTLT